MSLFGFFKKEEKPFNLMETLYNRYSEYGLSDEDLECIISNIRKLCVLNNISMESLSLISSISQDAIVIDAVFKVFKITTCDYRTETLSEYMSHSAHIQKPNHEITLTLKNRKFTVLDFDKLYTNRIKSSDVILMYINLRNDGYLWYDPRISNLGKDQDGKLYLIDYGQLVYINDMNEVIRNIELSCHKQSFPDLDELYRRGYFPEKKGFFR